MGVCGVASAASLPLRMDGLRDAEPVSRVEWTRLEGNDVEAVVAMFVNREQPNSVRITPSRGDGGVDILDRAAAVDGTDAVHQVKSYCEPLSSRQKDEVKKSLQTLINDPRWAALRVTTWYLVTPWDPTPEAEVWLQELGHAHGLTAVWRGLAYVDQLAAKYPDIVDYYVHGDRNRVEETYQSVLALVGIEGGERLDVPSVAARVQRALGTLNTDPHYRYELRFGEGGFPEPPSRQGLVMSWMSGQARGGAWLAVDIIARCAASVQERPITITGRFVAESGSDFEHSLRDFLSFGTPFTSPVGAYEGDIDAPGGLGGRLVGGTVTTLSVGDDRGESPHLHVEILDPDGAVLAAADIDRVERSRGAEGVRVVFEELHRVFRIEDRYELTTQTATRKLRLEDFTGQQVTAARSALEFVNHCRTPNVGRVSVRHTPSEMGVIDPNWGFLPPGEFEQGLKRLFVMIESLATIQQHTPTPVRVPDLDSTPPGEINRWRLAAKLLHGEDVTATYPEGQCLIVELDTEISAAEGPIGVTVPLTIQVGADQINLGLVEVWLADATLVERTVHAGRVHHAFTTPDRTYRYHRSSNPGS